MQKIVSVVLSFLLAVPLTACASSEGVSVPAAPARGQAKSSVSSMVVPAAQNNAASTPANATETPNTSQSNVKVEDETMQIKITVREKSVIAVLENNATTQALVSMLPLTLPMQDLYSRELCYRFDEELPTATLRADGYQVGDIIYWPPRHSLVILYAQNGEAFSRQHLGHIESGVEIFSDAGDTQITFELLG